VNIVILYNI